MYHGQLFQSAVATLDVDGRLLRGGELRKTDARHRESTDSKISGTEWIVNAGTHCSAGRLSLIHYTTHLSNILHRQPLCPSQHLDICSNPSLRSFLPQLPYLLLASASAFGRHNQLRSCLRYARFSQNINSPQREDINNNTTIPTHFLHAHIHHPKRLCQAPHSLQRFR
jgi:hypothetical protein